MLESGKITPGQAGFLMTLAVLGTSNLVMPAFTSRYAQMDAWITTVLATFPHVLLILVISRIGNIFPKESIVSYIGQITGKYPGIIIIIGYVWYLLYVTALIIRTVAEFLLTSFMPDTPIEVFIIVMLLLSALAVRAGLEVLGRAATFVTPLFLVSFGVILLLLTGDMNLSWLTPFFDSGFKGIIHGTLYPVVWRGEFILMLFIWPYINKSGEGLKSMLQVAFIILMAMLPITVASTSIFGPFTYVLSYLCYGSVYSSSRIYHQAGCGIYGGMDCRGLCENRYFLLLFVYSIK